MCSYKYLLICCALIAIDNTVHSEKVLRGVTIASQPFVNKTNDNPLELEGYAVDLIREIARIVGFEFNLYITPDTQYGILDKYGNPKGMIEEIRIGRADFAIADLTVIPIREQFVNFTEPFMHLDLSALISKKNVGNMTSFEDLINQNNITFGILRSGSTEHFLSQSTDPILVRLNQLINTYRYSYVSVYNRAEGIDRALTSNYAFIQESVPNEYAADQNCELTVINSPNENWPRDYAIAVQSNSQYLEGFNRAIRQLKADGTLDRLWNKYWRTKCLANSYPFPMNSRLNNFFYSAFSLLMSALISIILLS